jgi:hypothetical protein
MNITQVLASRLCDSDARTAEELHTTASSARLSASQAQLPMWAVARSLARPPPSSRKGQKRKAPPATGE